MAAHAASRNTDADYDAQVVHARLNSPERQAAIQEARRLDAAAREALAAQEAQEAGATGLTSTTAAPPAISSTSGSSSVIAAQASANVAPAHTSAERHSRAVPGSSPRMPGNPDSSALSASEQKALDSRLRGNDGARSSLATARPQTMTEVMFNGVTGFMGLPGLTSNANAPYNPNADQGLGFHADGTARRADGSTGDNAASAAYNGQRAAAYANSGVASGFDSPYGSMGGNGLSSSVIPAQAGIQNNGLDPLSASGLTRGLRGGDGIKSGGDGIKGGNPDFLNDPQQMLLDRGLNYGMGLANSAAEGLFLGVMDSPYEKPAPASTP